MAPETFSTPAIPSRRIMTLPSRDSIQLDSMPMRLQQAEMTPMKVAQRRTKGADPFICVAWRYAETLRTTREKRTDAARRERSRAVPMVALVLG